MKREFVFKFGAFTSKVLIQEDLPSLEGLAGDRKALLVCDTNTRVFADEICRQMPVPVCMLDSGEKSKTWESAAGIIGAAKEAGLGRDGLFIAVGGGVVSDITAFAASIYMRGAGLCVVSTTLLGMADAALGGKTGFDYLGIKNLVGTFYPAEQVIMPVNALKSLSPGEWKSGMAELIKTAVISDIPGGGAFFELVKTLKPDSVGLGGETPVNENLAAVIAFAVETKGRIVEEDPRETGGRRALLNLGHTFGHALESAAGLGTVSHGEAVAWGIARSCELGARLGVTPPERAMDIVNLLKDFGYETKAPYPLAVSAEKIIAAMNSDKKKKHGKPVFIVPVSKGAALVSEDGEGSPNVRSFTPDIIKKIINGEYGL